VAITKIYLFEPVETATYTWQVPRLWISLVLQQLQLISAPNSRDEVDDFLVGTSEITPVWSERMLGVLHGAARRTFGGPEGRKRPLWDPFCDVLSEFDAENRRFGSGAHSLLEEGMVPWNAVHKSNPLGGFGFVIGGSREEWIAELRIGELRAGVPMGPSEGFDWLRRRLSEAVAACIVFGLLAELLPPVGQESLGDPVLERVRRVQYSATVDASVPSLALILQAFDRYNEVCNA